MWPSESQWQRWYQNKMIEWINRIKGQEYGGIPLNLLSFIHRTILKISKDYVDLSRSPEHAR